MDGPDRVFEDTLLKPLLKVRHVFSPGHQQVREVGVFRGVLEFPVECLGVRVLLGVFLFCESLEGLSVCG